MEKLFSLIAIATIFTVSFAFNSKTFGYDFCVPAGELVEEMSVGTLPTPVPCPQQFDGTTENATTIFIAKIRPNGQNCSSAGNPVLCTEKIRIREQI